MLIANKIAHFTVLLLIYFVDQFVASKIRHRRHHCIVNNQHDIKRRIQDFDKMFAFEGYTAKRLTDEFSEKAGQSMVLISCSKSCGTQAHFNRRPGSGRSRSARSEENAKLLLQKLIPLSLPLTLFCPLSDEMTENTFFIRKQTKSVTSCGC